MSVQPWQLSLRHGQPPPAAQRDSQSLGKSTKASVQQLAGMIGEKTEELAYPAPVPDVRLCDRRFLALMCRGCSHLGL